MSETSHNAEALIMEVHSRQWTGRTRKGGFAVDLDRDDEGMLTESTRAAITAAIRDCVSSAPASHPCLCALAGSGISLRTLELPLIKNTSIHDLVRLQIEAEWPLPPEELVWGIHEWTRTNSNPPQQPTVRVTVAAIKKSLFAHYDELVRASGVEVTWTFHAFIAGSLQMIRSSDSAWLFDVRSETTDLIRYEMGLPTSIQHHSWGSTDSEALGANLQNTIQREEESNPEANTIVIAGSEPSLGQCSQFLEQGIPERKASLICIPSVEGATLSSEAFQALEQETRECPMIQLKVTAPATIKPKFDRRSLLRWAALILLMVVSILLARRIEPSLRGTALQERLQNFNSEKEALPEIDRELTFLSYLHENTIPVTDVISLLAANAVPQFEIQSLEISRDRRIQLRGTLPQRAQPEDLRAKLFKTGWFEQVVLDEQTPDERKRKLTIRMSLMLHDQMKRPKLSKKILGLSSSPKKGKK